jgi:hypothetical protein
MRATQTSDALLAATLTVLSLGLWFCLGFPWQHHNESLVWAIELQKASLWEVWVSNPITPVQTYRPLGVMLAWLGFHATHGGIWLQQLFNLVFTAVAWIVALLAAKRSERLTFAWLACVAIGGFFSGYIYLFHLHGVFYGPLLLFLALLQRDADRDTALTWRSAGCLLGLAVIFAAFHTFAFLFFAAYVSGRWLQNRLLGRPASVLAALATILLAAIATKLLVASSSDLVQGGLMAGLLASYKAFEINALLSGLAIVLAVLAGATGTRTKRRALGGLLALGLGLVCWAMHLPAIFAWIIVCQLRTLFSGRFALAALIAVTALLPIATATGSPTYALFVVMPCIAVTAHGWDWSERSHRVLRRAALAALIAVPTLLLALKLGITVPGVSKLVQPLQAEREKTEQMAQVFRWLDAHQDISGGLTLCQPGDFPVRSNTAVERQYRAPTHTWPFNEYLKARYGTRLVQAAPMLLLCFGGDTREGAEVLDTVPGRWANAATLLRLPAP